MKTLAQLWESIEHIGFCCSGSFSVAIIYHGKKLTCSSNNTLAFDRINADHIVNERVVLYGYTLRQAYQASYDECVRKNIK